MSELTDALEEYRAEVDPLKDLLLAADEAEAAELVRDVGRRLRAANQAAAAAKAKTEPKEPERSPDEQIAAYRKANRTGSRAVQNPGDLWAALWAKQAPEREAEANGENDRPPPGDEWERYLVDRRGEAS